MEYTATSVRFSKKTLKALKIRAVKERKSLAQLIRDAIEATYHLVSPAKGVDPQGDPLSDLAGAWESGLKDGAVHHDRDIYGRSRGDMVGFFSQSPFGGADVDLSRSKEARRLDL